MIDKQTRRAKAKALGKRADDSFWYSLSKRGKRTGSFPSGLANLSEREARREAVHVGLNGASGILAPIRQWR